MPSWYQGETILLFFNVHRSEVIAYAEPLGDARHEEISGGIHGDDLVRCAVAVHVIFLKRFHHRDELLGGFRRFQAELLQPVLADVDDAAGGGGLVFVGLCLNAGVSVDIAVRRGGELCHERIVFRE